MSGAVRIGGRRVTAHTVERNKRALAAQFATPDGDADPLDTLDHELRLANARAAFYAQVLEDDIAVRGTAALAVEQGQWADKVRNDILRLEAEERERARKVAIDLASVRIVLERIVRTEMAPLLHAIQALRWDEQLALTDQQHEAFYAAFCRLCHRWTSPAELATPTGS